MGNKNKAKEKPKSNTTNSEPKIVPRSKTELAEMEKSKQEAEKAKLEAAKTKSKTQEKIPEPARGKRSKPVSKRSDQWMSDEEADDPPPKAKTKKTNKARN